MKKMLQSNVNDSLPLMQQTIRIGLMIIAVFFGVLGIWATFAPLEAASVAPGKIISATYKKTISHLEIGIIKAIYVKDGSIVKKGQILIQLDDTQPRAAYDAAHEEMLEALATEARLKAQRDKAATITFPDELLKEENNPAVKEIIDSEQAHFETEQDTLNGQLKIYQQRIDELNQQITSIQAQVSSEDTQLAIFADEIKAFTYLEQKHLIEKTRLWSEQREQAKVVGSRGEQLSNIEQTKQKIGETEEQVITLKASTYKDILDKLTETEGKLSELIQREKSAKDILLRTAIVAPQDGVVTNLQEHTIGGVITPGKPILDIVPSQDKLIVEAHVNVLNIDVVHTGLKAHVQLIAYKQRRTPTLDGVVTYVSADSFEDPQTKEKYYLAYVNVSTDELSKLEDVHLYPGMPVQVMIVSGRRSALSYIFTPITDSFHKAFNEQ